VSGNTCLRCPYADKPNLNIRGAGDVIHRATHATGIAKLVHALEELTGIPCGCSGRLRDYNNWFKKKRNQLAGEWAVAVTTAPRVECTLQECVASLIANSWVPYIFAEPDSDLTGCGMFTTIQNEHRLGAWYNWLNSCRYVLENTTADYILTVQDDTVFEAGAREWVEANPITSNKLGMASLYTSTKYFTPWSKGRRKYTPPSNEGWFRVNTSFLWGACAMVFPRKVLEDLLDHKKTKQWRGASSKSRTRPRSDPEVQNVDTAVSKILGVMRKQIWLVNPSLSQHIGKTPTAVNHVGAIGKRRASRVGIPKITN
jgi:hypothetical protein